MISFPLGFPAGELRQVRWWCCAWPSLLGWSFLTYCPWTKLRRRTGRGRVCRARGKRCTCWTKNHVLLVRIYNWYLRGKCVHIMYVDGGKNFREISGKYWVLCRILCGDDTHTGALTTNTLPVLVLQQAYEAAKYMCRRDYNGLAPGTRSSALRWLWWDDLRFSG